MAGRVGQGKVGRSSIEGEKKMASAYNNLTEGELRRLRSLRVLRITKLSSIERGWFQEQEMRRCTAQVDKIDALLRRWEAQERLF